MKLLTPKPSVPPESILEMMSVLYIILLKMYMLVCSLRCSLDFYRVINNKETFRE